MPTFNRNPLFALVLLTGLALSPYVQAQGPDNDAPAKPADKAIGVAPVRPAEHLGENHYALIIGINDYKDAAIPDLQTCENDAKAIHTVLTTQAHGGVKPDNATLLLGKDATFRNIRKAFNDLRRIPADATVFIYFSGHGAKEADEAFWVTQDAELQDLAATGLPDRDVRAFISRIPAQRIIVMIDACYAAATVKGGDKSIVDFDAVLGKFTGKGVAYLMAAGSGEEAIEAADLKHSVFTYHLLQGLQGKADSNTDGVVVLPELTTYIDKHVAEEARKRGGIQKPTTLQDVQEPAKFRLTIDAPRIAANLRESAAAKALRLKRLAALEALYLDEKLTRDQAQQGLALLNADRTTLAEPDAKRLGYYERVADGSFEADKLQRALDLIETPAQREARLARESALRAAAERSAKITDLLTKAKANDSEEQGKAALAALEELLKLDPAHAEAKKLRDKIAAYFGPPLAGFPLTSDAALEAQKQTATYLKVKTTQTNSIGMELTLIPAGKFTMGSPRNEEGRRDGETQHEVTLSKPFLMGTTEVTQAQWEAVMGTNPSRFKGKDLPVETVSWEDAVKFCEKLSKKEGKTYRLPTEAEWEYACRAGTTTAYHTGDSVESLKRAGWYGAYASPVGNSGKQTNRVGQKSSNAWGLYDMHGNVYEWCSDWFGDYPSNAATDPAGPGQGTSRVLRGGSWYSFPALCRAACRRRSTPDRRSGLIGFRVVCSLSAGPGLAD